MKALILLTLFFVAVISARPPPPNPNGVKAPEWWTKGKTILLRSNTFENVVGKEKYSFIQFCSMFSPGCEELAPHFEKLTEKYMTADSDRDDVFIAKIDGWTFSSTSQEYGVKFFPDVLFFKKETLEGYERYDGEKTAEKMIEWLEAKINSLEKEEEKKLKGKEATEQKEEQKQEEKKTEKTPEPEKPVVTEHHTQEPAKAQVITNTNTQQQQQQQPPQQPSEVKVVLNTTLLQAQFDELTKRILTLEQNLGFKITDAVIKIDDFVKNQLAAPTEQLKVLSQAHQDQARKFENLDKDLVMMKKEVMQGITSHTEKQLSDVKSTVSSIKTKVFETKVAPPKESNIGMYILMITIGVAIGGAAGFFFASGGAKPKTRSYLD